VRVRLATAVVLCLLGLPHAGQAAAPVPRIWPLGDSITVGASWPKPVPGGYRTAFDELLSRDGYAHVFIGTTTVNDSPTLRADGQVAHDGHGGFRIDQIRRDLDGLAHTSTDDGGHWLTGTAKPGRLAPDVAVIHLGTNDILRRWDTHRFPTRTGRADFADLAQRTRFVADMSQRLEGLLGRIHSLRPGCRLVVATIVPIDSPSYAAVMSAYAASVRQLVRRLEARRYPVSLVDLDAAFRLSNAPGAPVAPGLLSSDRIHPSAAGYVVMARAFAVAVEQGARVSHRS
jgi:lysophospholipase L1-like esterase